MAAKQASPRKNVKNAKGTNAGSQTSASKKSKKAKKTRRKHHWLRWIIALLIVAVLVVLGAFSWDRWLRYDDALDMQGEWKASGQTAVVVIDNEQIKLTDEVAYSYTLDTWDKTIDFTFGKLSGAATYQFSEDRSTLVIVEGGTTDLIGDFLKVFGFVGTGFETSDSPTTVFIKLSTNAAVDPQVMKQEPTPDAAGDISTDANADGTAEGGTTEGEGHEDIDGDTSSLFDTITDRSGPQ